MWARPWGTRRKDSCKADEAAEQESWRAWSRLRVRGCNDARSPLPGTETSMADEIWQPEEIWLKGWRWQQPLVMGLLPHRGLVSLWSAT